MWHLNMHLWHIYELKSTQSVRRSPDGSASRCCAIPHQHQSLLNNKLRGWWWAGWTARHSAAEASGVEEFLPTEVQREEGPFSVAAGRTAERLLTRTHHLLTGILAVETQIQMRVITQSSRRLHTRLGVRLQSVSERFCLLVQNAAARLLTADRVITWCQVWPPSTGFLSGSDCFYTLICVLYYSVHVNGEMVLLLL